MKLTHFVTVIAVFGLAACDEPATPVGPNEYFPARAAAAAAADPSPVVAYSNFGPGKTFDSSIQSGYTINGFINPQVGEQAISAQFTPSSNGAFASAEVAVVAAFGPPSMRAVLQADANGLPGTVLEDIPLQGLQPVPTVIAAASTLRPLLRVDTQYWLTVVAGAAGFIGEWNLNSIGDVATGNLAVTGTGNPVGPWGPLFGIQRPAFQINVFPPTVQDAIRSLIERLSALMTTGALDRGQGTALLVKLSSVLASLDRDDTRAACGQLGAFMNQARALVETGRLEPVSGGQLVDLALQASSRTGCA